MISLAAKQRDTDPEDVWAAIGHTVSTALHAIGVEIAGSEPEALKSEPEGIRRTSFQLIGVDVLLDEDLKPHLLEVNHSPSLAIGKPRKLGEKASEEDEDGDTGEAKALDEALKIAVVCAALQWGAEGITPGTEKGKREKSPHAPRAEEWIQIPQGETVGTRVLRRACGVYRECCGAIRLHTGLTKALWEKAAQSIEPGFDKEELKWGWEAMSEKTGSVSMDFREFLETLILLACRRQAEAPPAQTLASWVQ